MTVATLTPGEARKAAHRTKREIWSDDNIPEAAWTQAQNRLANRKKLKQGKRPKGMK